MKKSLGPSCIVHVTPVWVVGTYGDDGKPNGAAVAWGGICANKPPCIAVALRPARYTHGNITRRKALTVCIPSEGQVKEADYFGIASGRDTDKFAATGLTPVKSELVDAPYIEEYSVALECKLVQAVEIGTHTQFIGEILDVKADQSVLGEGGFPDIEKIHPIIFAPGVETYHGVGRFLGKTYAMGRDIGKSRT